MAATGRKCWSWHASSKLQALNFPLPARLLQNLDADADLETLLRLAAAAVSRLQTHQLSSLAQTQVGPEGNLLQPFLMGQSMKLHAFVILIALTVGTVLGGIVGAIISVPITAVAWGIVKVWDGPRTPARWARPKNRATEIAAEG